MKICFVADARSIHSYRWIVFFNKAGFEVDWVSFSPSLFDIPTGIHFHCPIRSTSRIIQMITGVLFLRQLATKRHFDLIHGHYVGVNGVAAYLSGIRPLVLTAWGSDILFAGKAIFRGALIRIAIRAADLITTDAKHMLKEMTAMKVRGNRMRLHYFGTDTDIFSPTPRNEKLATALNIGKQQVIFSLRNFSPVYDIPTLIRAIPLVIRKVPETVFIIAGSGSEKDYLHNLAKELGINMHIRFTGAIPNTELPCYFSLADIYISTSLSDAGLSGSTAEAMSSELPVIITESGENSAWVQDNVNGFLIPIKQPVLLAEKIVLLLNNPDLRRAMGKKNRKIIEEKNSYKVQMAAMERIYKELVSKQNV